jgi:hypothetical protein
MTDLASRWRLLAEETFARADRVHDADIREKICRIAARYERLAQQVEDQSGARRKIPVPAKSKPHIEMLAGAWKGLLRASR